MIKKISLLEDLSSLFPTSAFSLSLDNQKEAKNTVILSESLSISESDELTSSEHLVLCTSKIKCYLEADESLADFDSIYSLLYTFYSHVLGLEGQSFQGFRIFRVNQDGLFGYLGRTREGYYSFSLNFKVEYYI